MNYKADNRPKESFSLFKWIDHSLGLDKIFENGFPLRFVPHVLYLTCIGLFYIGNTHYSDRINRSFDKLKVEVDDLRTDYATLKAQYMFESKQSEVAKKVMKLGLEESNKPPYKIVDPQTE